MTVIGALLGLVGGGFWFISRQKVANQAIRMNELTLTSTDGQQTWESFLTKQDFRSYRINQGMTTSFWKGEELRIANLPSDWFRLGCSENEQKM